MKDLIAVYEIPKYLKKYYNFYIQDGQEITELVNGNLGQQYIRKSLYDGASAVLVELDKVKEFFSVRDMFEVKQ